jgi:hypothetical protein
MFFIGSRYDKYVTKAKTGILPNKARILALTGEHSQGRTVAHHAARYGTLPTGFNLWELANKDGWTVAHEAARYKNLPADFKQWSIADKDGRTVAHEAIYAGNMPKDFDQWDISGDGGAVGLYAAMYGRLPEDFDLWDIANNEGWTVAHEAAMRGNLPLHFDRWSIKDFYGKTVLSVAVENDSRFSDLWKQESPLCHSNEDMIAFKKELPEIYMAYWINNSMDQATQSESFSMEML